MSRVLATATFLHLCLVGCARSSAPESAEAVQSSTAPTPSPEAPAPQVPSDPDVVERESGAKVWTYTFDGVRVHTYMAPYEAFANTTHIVESANSVVVVDSQMTIASAQDARALVDSLNKPISRLIVSHAHPDHYLGIAAAWEDVSVHALPSTIAEITSSGEEVRKARVAMFPEGWLADHVTPPTVAITPGAVTIDDVEFVFEERKIAEHAEQLVIRLPDLSTTIAQDLVYTDVHPVITSRDAIDSWIGHTDAMSTAGGTVLVLPGHGSPTNGTGLVAMKTYLSTAKGLLDAGADGDSFKTDIMQAFPDRGGEGFVDFSVMFMFGG